MIQSDESNVSLSERETANPPSGAGKSERTMSISYMPTPTAEYRTNRKLRRATVTSALPSPLPIPYPFPFPVPGPRVLIYKQDPVVGEIGIRKAWLPARVYPGPSDARIALSGVQPVSSNALGDYIQFPGTEAFDAVHTFAVVRQSLTLFQRALFPNPIPWQWNSANNTAPINVFPRAGETMNAYYSRTQKALKFFWFTPPNQPNGPLAYTCRSFDIVAHETGHAVLDGLKPNWLLFNNPPQTGGLHESFGDLTAIFLALSQIDQVEAVIAQTKANLHDKTFLSDVAEQFGLALGRPNGLRNADNDFKLSQVSTEVHAISQVMTGGIYDFLADVFALEWNRARQDPALTLVNVGTYVFGLYLRAIKNAPAQAATFADVVNGMIALTIADGKPDAYRTSLKSRFVFREVLAAVPLAGAASAAGFAPDVEDAENAIQNRSSCCGTMQLGEYCEAPDAELQALRRHFEGHNGHGEGRKGEPRIKPESRIKHKV